MILVDNGDANGDTPPNILRTSNPIWYNANNCTPLEALVSYWIDSFWCLQLWNHQEIRLKEDVADLRRLIQEIWRNASWKPSCCLLQEEITDGLAATWIIDKYSGSIQPTAWCCWLVAEAEKSWKPQTLKSRRSNASEPPLALAGTSRCGHLG